MLPSSNMGVGMNTGFPDVCNTPIGTGTAPITYPNIGMNVMSLPCLPNVLVSLLPGFNQTNKPTMTNGDNAGVAHSSFMQSGGNNCGAVNVLTGGAPCESLANPTQGNNYNCSTDAKLVPSIVNVLINFQAADGAARLHELLDLTHPALGWTAAADDPTRVVHVRRGGLSARLGVQPGDCLQVERDGAQVRLQVGRDGARWTGRARLPELAAPVAARLLEPGLGWLVVRRCSWNAPAQARRALAALAAQGARSLVLDLRGNPGGLLQSATALAGLFLPARRVVAEAGDRRYATGDAGPRWSGGLTVWVDRGTASAAEVLAAALADRGRLVGATTQGKTAAVRLGGQETYTVRRPGGAARALTPETELGATRALDRVIALAR